MPTLGKRIITNKRGKATHSENVCTCVHHPEPTEWSICPVRVICSAGVPYSAFFSRLYSKNIRNQQYQYGHNGYLKLNEGYECRKLQALATLTDPPQYYICEAVVYDFSVKVMGPFASINDVITNFQNHFKELTGVTWKQRHGLVSNDLRHYCYVEYEPLRDDGKEKKLIKAWKFTDRERAFVPVHKNTNEEQEQEEFISLENLDAMDAIYHYTKDPQAVKQRSIILKNPLFARMKLSVSTLNQATQQINALQKLFQQRDHITLQQVGHIVDIFGALLPPVGCKEKLMTMLHTMPNDQFLCDRLHCLLNLFKENEEVYMVPQFHLDNILQWERPLTSKIISIDVTSQEYTVIRTYLTNSSYCNKKEYRIEAIFSIQNEMENARFKNYQTAENRKLLWHGTSATNVKNILSWGLQAPTNLYTSRDIQFTDMAAQAMGYCRDYAKDFYGMFLCEVALGKRLPLGYPQEIANAEGHPWHFVEDGWCFPNKFEDIQLEDGTIVPVGKSTCCTHDIKNRSHCTHPEYYVSREKFTRVRYFVICKASGS